MTNTHITIGGHKITTNKVGELHSITNLKTGWTGTLWWTVNNGICYLAGDTITNSSAGGGQIIYEGNIPLPKGYSPTFLVGNGGGGVLGTVIVGVGRIIANMDLTGTSWWSVTYPVRDDWSE